MRILFVFLILWISFFAEAGRIRLRKVKDAPRSCAIMKEETSLSRDDKKILGTEKNSIVIDETVSVIGDLGNKLCEWPKEKFSEISDDPLKMSFYIDEFKNILVVYQKNINEQKTFQQAVQQVQINLDTCQFGQLRTLSEVSLPKCDPPKKAKKSRKKKKK